MLQQQQQQQRLPQGQQMGTGSPAQQYNVPNPAMNMGTFAMPNFRPPQGQQPGQGQDGAQAGASQPSAAPGPPAGTGGMTPQQAMQMGLANSNPEAFAAMIQQRITALREKLPHTYGPQRTQLEKQISDATVMVNTMRQRAAQQRQMQQQQQQQAQAQQQPGQQQQSGPGQQNARPAMGAMAAIGAIGPGNQMTRASPQMGRPAFSPPLAASTPSMQQGSPMIVHQSTAPSPAQRPSTIPKPPSSVGQPELTEEKFKRALNDIMIKRGSPLPPQPMAGGKPLVLWKLYSIVSSMGGSEAVTRNNQWVSVVAALDLAPPSSAMAMTLALQVSQQFTNLVVPFEEAWTKAMNHKKEQEEFMAARMQGAQQHHLQQQMNQGQWPPGIPPPPKLTPDQLASMKLTQEQFEMIYKQRNLQQQMQQRQQQAAMGMLPPQQPQDLQQQQPQGSAPGNAGAMGMIGQNAMRPPAGAQPGAQQQQQQQRWPQANGQAGPSAASQWNMNVNVSGFPAAKTEISNEALEEAKRMVAKIEEDALRDKSEYEVHHALHRILLIFLRAQNPGLQSVTSPRRKRKSCCSKWLDWNHSRKQSARYCLLSTL